MTDATFQDLWTVIGPDLPSGADHLDTLRQDSLRGTVPPLPPLPLSQAMDTDADLVVTEVLGEGGMGTVFAARQRSLEREVAIKQLKPGASELHRAGLLREGRFMGTLEHPNIVPVHALGLDQHELPTLVMKRVEGTSWSDLIKGRSAWEEHGTWPEDPVLRSVLVLTEVCKALQFAHSKGVVHRDLKPTNVMVGRFGEVYLVDWGIACHWEKQREKHRLVGTPAYMAPEMVNPARGVSPATDVYLLGACLHRVLTGVPPHMGPDLRAVLEKAHASAPPTYDSDVPSELAAICTRAMAALPSHRFEDVAAFRAALDAFVQHRGSARLARAAEHKSAQIDQLLTDDPHDPTLPGLFREAEFAFRQALVDWPENPSALEGLHALLDQRVDWCLDRDDLEGAAADLEVLRAIAPGPSEALEARVAQARATWERLRDRVHDEDPRANYRDRRRFVIAVMLFLAVAGLLQSERLMSPWVPYGTGYLLSLVAVAGTPLALGMFAFRKRLFADSVSRRLMWLMLANALIFFSGRLWAFVADIEPWIVLGLEMVYSAGGCFVIAIFLRPQWWRLGVVCLAMAAAVALFPSWAGECYALGAGLIALLQLTNDHSGQVG